MDTNALKKFAQDARTQLIEQVASRFDRVIAESSIERREHPQIVKQLDKAVSRDGRAQVIDKVAYTWFNRFTALRFMDANGYNRVRVVSPADGATRPEILAEAAAGNLSDGAPDRIIQLLDGRIPSNDAQGEAYRLLLVHDCNALHKVLPYMFEAIDDFSELLMPDDLLSNDAILAKMRAVMTEDACQDVEIIGWLYQFYISEKKDQVFAGLKKNQKITAENIPAATQLFTPHWIVRYLVENSLGRLWLLNNPHSGLAAKMDYYIAPEEPETDFLRITKPEEIRICDPAAGSGHMLTYAFDLLYAIYEEEGYDATEIPALILTHNLTGVEIDDRAGALAAFALAMKAAGKLGRRRFLRMEAKPDICVLQNVAFTEAEMQDVATVVGEDLFTDELRETLGQFEQAKNFGSLIVPKLDDPAESLRVVEARDFGSDLLLKEMQERVITVLRMAEALSPKYHVVVANPPYMGSKGMNGKLSDFAKEHYPESKSDLFAMFMERTLRMAVKHGMMAMINMQSWMFLSSFEKLRSSMLSNACLQSMAHLGPRAFDTIGGEVVSTTAFVFGNYYSADQHGTYLRLVDGSNEVEKAQIVLDAKAGKTSGVWFSASVAEITKLPGKPIAYWLTNNFRGVFDSNCVVEELAEKVTKGIFTGDNNRFLRFWYEVSNQESGWKKYDKAGESRRWFGSAVHVVDWRRNGTELKNFSGAGLGAMKYYDKPHFVWSGLSTGTPSYRFADDNVWFDDVSPSVIGAKQSGALLAYLNSRVATKVLMTLNPTLHYQIGDVKRIPVPDLKADFLGISNACVSLARSDWDAYETSWDFTMLPLLSPDHRGETLEDRYAALRAHWQSMTDKMQALEEENNRIFIDAYGLQDELTPDVPIEEITLTCNPAYRYGMKSSEEDREARLRADTMAEFLSYAVGCMFGRYSLDAPGLILANQGETLEDYLAHVPSPTFAPDDDNVIPVLDEDWFSDDIVARFRKFLRVTFGDEHFQENLRFVEKSLGKELRKYFTKDFYNDHVKRYKKRPIYWMFSSPKGTFNALIYMHRYRSDTVSVVLNDYLREFINKLQGERARLDKLADDATATQGQRAKALKDSAKIAKQIDELTDWERDVVFPLAQQRVEIDLDDGVKANYPKFGTALKKIAGLS
ncbi:BREX-1 system adenine-specific DNA-methyltransferase PglX [Ruegeria arenilitoris]|uniref:BREX-1 system adenine-specific DNA-methyltransferase PglX n=1 Tax=Ruegeria arenilitoris TaxID=1173585 RepID=UPI001C948920|nr:BREX-1 system adenine-specific DNA-methyltransferase PglX [Ruegeria arenilitoris]MBY6082088.1 BREX-1 system adenine-specific DNA-methyltransferase PglX [Ruegeria arenilitoris]